MGGNLFCWEEGLPTFPAGATVADADLGATSGAMDMYDEFGNYVGPELDDDSDGGSGEDQDEVRAKRSLVDSTANARIDLAFPNYRADRALLFAREVSSGLFSFVAT